MLMMMKTTSTLALILLGLLASTISSTVQAAQSCTYSQPIYIDDDQTVSLEQYKDDAAGTFTMRIKYSGGQSWIGIGINSEGRDKMTPATAVIGRADEDVETGEFTGTYSVLKYDLVSDSKDGDGVVPMSNDQQNLIDTSFTQSDTESVLEFTQYLNEPTQVVKDDSVWIYAVGLPDNQWTGKHRTHGAFWLGLEDGNCVAPASTPAVQAQAPSQGDTSGNAADNSQWGGGGDNNNNAGGTTSSNNNGEDPSAGGNNEGGGKNSDKKNNNNNEPGTTHDNSSGKSPESSKNSGTEEGDSNVAPGGNSGGGSYDTSASASNSGVIVMNTSQDEGYIRSLWIAHGLFMFFAWGICAPLAIGAPILKNLSFLKEGGRWYKIHLYGNILLVFFTFIGFFLAVGATSQDGDEHFMGEVHKKAGLAIFIIVLFQAAAGYFRPPATSGAAPARNGGSDSDSTSPNTSKPLHLSETNDMEESSDGDDIEVSAPPPPPKTSSSEDDAPVKSKVRIGWEITHRMVGVILVGLAWYNCHSGYTIMGEDYEESDDWSTAFWVITCLISIPIFFAAYIVRV